MKKSKTAVRRCTCTVPVVRNRTWYMYGVGRYRLAVSVRLCVYLCVNRGVIMTASLYLEGLWLLTSPAVGTIGRYLGNKHTHRETPT